MGWEIRHFARFEGIPTMLLKLQVSWNVTLCSTETSGTLHPTT